jgi:hypothetical protein
MPPILLAASLTLFAASEVPSLDCVLCGDDPRPLYLAWSGDGRESALVDRIDRIDRQIASTSRRFPAGAGILAAFSGCFTLISPLPFVAFSALALETGAAGFAAFAVASILVGPIVLVTAVAWGALTHRRNQEQLRDLQDERYRLQRELRELREQRDDEDIPPPPLVPVVTLRF